MRQLWRTRGDGPDESDPHGWSSNALSGGGLADLVLEAVLWVVIAVVVFVVLPLVGLVLELIAITMLFLGGLLGHLVLRRPWTVEAVSVEDPRRVWTQRITGWRQSRRAIRSMAMTIERSGAPV
jgi:hypothetical protein